MFKPLIAIPAVLMACACARPEAGPRPSTWASSVERPGLPNLHQLSDELYRSAQPTAEGFASLRTLEVRTVVNLRMFHSDQPLARGTGLTLVDIPMESWDLDLDEVERFLEVVTDRQRQPVLVHCLHGADRTGTMSAVYRMVVQGWSVDDAIAEMRDGGFGFHSVWNNLPFSLRHLDVEALRKRFTRH
ncbi:MAG: dual specificity protein phosphatase family protein [Pseudomonadota bacterium]